MRRGFIGWLFAALACSGAVAAGDADPDAPVVVRCAYPSDGATDAALGQVEVPDIGVVTLRGLRKGIDVIVTVVSANGASIGHTETLVGLSPASPVLVPTDRKNGLALILIHWKPPAN